MKGLTAYIKILLIFSFLACSSVFAAPIDFYGGDFTVEYKGKIFDGTNSKFSYEVCAVDPDPGEGFSHITFEIPMCPDSAIQILASSCNPTGCEVGKDPTTNVDNGIKWNDTINDGQCKTYSFEAAGDVPEGTINVFIKAGNCNTTESCESQQLTGPGCSPSSTPTPTPTPASTPTPIPSPTPTPTSTPTPIPSPTPTIEGCTLSAEGGPECKGKATTISLNADIFGVIGTPIFDWFHDCGDNATLNATDSSATLELGDPGIGKASMCSVTLTVFNDSQKVFCEADIFVEPCARDCKGEIIPATRSSAQQVAVLDRCGVCDGDGTSCLDCESSLQTESLFELDGSAFQQRRLVQKAVGLLRKVTGQPIGKTTLTRAEELYISNWSLTWAIPEVTLNCANKDLCSEVVTTSNIADYKINAEELRDIAVSKARKARKSNRSTGLMRQRRVNKLARRIINRASKRFQDAIDTADGVDTTSDFCA